jgi:hypothetical protein
LFTYAVFQLALIKVTDLHTSPFAEYELRGHYLFAFLPVAMLIAIGLIRSWTSLWYYGLALLTYSLLILKQQSTPSPNRFLVGTYLALCVVSLGALIDISNVQPLNAASGVAFFHFCLQVLIFFGCGLIGLALPYFVLRDARR